MKIAYLVLLKLADDILNPGNDFRLPVRPDQHTRQHDPFRCAAYIKWPNPLKAVVASLINIRNIADLG